MGGRTYCCIVACYARVPIPYPPVAPVSDTLGDFIIIVGDNETNQRRIVKTWRGSIEKTASPKTLPYGSAEMMIGLTCTLGEPQLRRRRVYHRPFIFAASEHNLVYDSRSSTIMLCIFPFTCGGTLLSHRTPDIFLQLFHPHCVLFVCFCIQTLQGASHIFEFSALWQLVRVHLSIIFSSYPVEITSRFLESGSWHL